MDDRIIGCPRCKAPADTPHQPGCDFTGGMRQGTTAKDYHDAPYGIGPIAAAWQDKPHRVLFDLKDEVIKLQAEKAELLAACQKVLSILDLQPQPKLGGWNWPVIADEIRVIVAKHIKT